MGLGERIERLEAAVGVPDPTAPHCAVCDRPLPAVMPADLIPLPGNVYLCRGMCFTIYLTAQARARDECWVPCRGAACPHRRPEWADCGRCYGLDWQRYWQRVAVNLKLLVAAERSRQCR